MMTPFILSTVEAPVFFLLLVFSVVSFFAIAVLSHSFAFFPLLFTVLSLKNPLTQSQENNPLLIYTCRHRYCNDCMRKTLDF